MKIAIIGAGLAGLGAAWHLASQHSVVIFEGDCAGAGSSIPVGLLHPYIGKRAQRSLHAGAAMEAAFELLDAAEKASGMRVCNRSGILRIAVSEQQRKDFQTASLARISDAKWILPEETLSKIPGAVSAPGLWIPNGATVFLLLYRKALLEACRQKGAQMISHNVRSLQELSSFDAIVIAAGFRTLAFPECAHLPLKLTKGHVLLCHAPHSLSCSALSRGYLSCTEDPGIWQLGATYERHFSTLDVDAAKALELKEKVAEMYPAARALEDVQLRVGVRISPKHGYQPILEKVSQKTWVITGLGSRGLLYHGWLGKALAIDLSHAGG